jgi:iron complex outermembrane receptor protein
VLTAAPVEAQTDARAQDLKKLSIEELAQVEVTSVSRRPEALSHTAAAVSVISSEDIRRSGTVVLAEVMRLGDGVDVARVNGGTWGISTRGFNISTSNKLLVLIDGRSTYSGLFGGTFWDVQDTFVADLDRVEVIRGPGATIWGANAVNGVINIISKPAAQTQGATLVLSGGINERVIAAGRYGGAAGRGHYRVFGKYRMRDAQMTPAGASTHDELQFGQGGFRFDSDQSRGVFWSLSGAAYRGTNGFADRPDGDVSGGHFLGRWTRRTSGNDALTVQAYYDRSNRTVPRQFDSGRDVAELDVQQRLDRGRHLLIAGGTGRVTRDDDLGTAGFIFEPRIRKGWTATAFAQDEITLATDRAYLIAGAKFGRNDFTGVEFQPSVRFRFHPSSRQMAWGAVSKAVRLPTRFDDDLRLVVPSTGRVFLRGSDDFAPETVVAYEGGYRIRLHPRLSLDTAAFVNDYDRLRSQEHRFEPTPIVVLENRLNARTTGIELAATLQPVGIWRLHGSYAWLSKTFTFDPGGTDTTGGVSEANDPAHLVSARSYVDLPRDLALDAVFRFVGRRPEPEADAYAELDLRLGWAVRAGWELSLVGQNLLHDRHAELFSPSTPTMFPRSVFLRSVWMF